MIRLVAFLAAAILAAASTTASTKTTPTTPTTANSNSRTLFVTSADGQEGLELTLALLSPALRDNVGPGAGASPGYLSSTTIIAGVANASSDAAHTLRAAGAQVRQVSTTSTTSTTRPQSRRDDGAVHIDPAVFAGVDCVFVLAPLTAERASVAAALIDAARAAEVEDALLLSVVGLPSAAAATAAAAPAAGGSAGVPASMRAYLQQEQHLRKVWPSAHAVVLRTFFYQQNLLLWANDTRAHAHHPLRLPFLSSSSSSSDDDDDSNNNNSDSSLLDESVTHADASSCFAPLYNTDVARVVAALVAGSGRDPTGRPCNPKHALCGWAGATLNLTGPRSLSGLELAAAGSAATGRSLTFEHVQRQVAETVLEQSGALDPSEATLVLDLLQTQTDATQARAFGCASSTVADVTGTGATDVEVFFHEHSSAFAGSSSGGGREQGDNLRDLDAELLALLQAQGLHDIVINNSLGLWVSVRTADGDSVNAALGYSSAPQFVDPNSTVPPTVALPTDIVPAGSLTKSFVAAAVMRLVEAGELGINDTALPLANQALRNWGANVTLDQLYPPQLANATLQQLLSMSTGIMEYSDAAVKATTDLEPSHDITPQEYLTNLTLNPARESWRCGANATSPVTCDPPTYCSMGFLVLALAVAGHTGAASWQAVDWKSLSIPQELLADPTRPAYNASLRFFTNGPCSDYPGVAHYYDDRGAGFEDLHSASCLNGWGFGNVGASAAAAADFFYDLVGREPRIVDGLTALQMQQWGGVLADHHTERYGLGLMYLPLARYAFLNISAPGAAPYSFGVGHNGCDYGTYTHNIYLPTLGAGLSIMINRDQGLSANGTAIPGSGEELFCLAYRAVFHLLLANNSDIGDFDIDTAFACPEQA